VHPPVHTATMSSFQLLVLFAARNALFDHDFLIYVYVLEFASTLASIIVSL